MKRSLFYLLTTIVLISGCGGGNQASTPREESFRTVSQVSAVTIQSGSILSTAQAFLNRGITNSEQLEELSVFKICVKRIKLEDEDGNTILKDPAAADTLGVQKSGEDKEGKSEAEKEQEVQDEKIGEMVFSPGLIDLTDSQTKSWGEIQLPVGFRLKKLIIIVKKDEKKCGVDYSLNYNGYKSEQDVEFKWKFEPAIDLEAATESLQLSFNSVVARLKEAVQSGSIEKLKERVEEVEGSATAKQ